VHLAGFIIRIYHDARSSECQIRPNMFNSHPAYYSTTMGDPVPGVKGLGLYVDRSTPSRVDITNYPGYTTNVSHSGAVWSFIQRRDNLTYPLFTHSTDNYNIKIGRYDLKISLLRHTCMAKIYKLSRRQISLFWDITLRSLRGSTSTYQKKWLPLSTRIYLPWWWRQQVPPKRHI